MERRRLVGRCLEVTLLVWPIGSSNWATWFGHSLKGSTAINTGRRVVSVSLEGSLLRTFVLIIILFFVSCSAVCEEPYPIKIAGIFDLSSGAGASWGVTEKNSFLMAVSEFERAHPEVQVSYKIEDSAYSNTKSVNALQKVSSVEGIKYVIGPTWEVFKAIMPICEARHIICISPSYSNEDFEDPKLKYSFATWFDDREYSLAHAPYINDRKYKRMAIFASISPYYDSMLDALLAALEIKPLAVEKVSPDTRDFRALITRTPKEIEALGVFILGDGSAQNFFRQWSELRKDRPDVFSDDVPLYFNPPIDLLALGFRVFYSVAEIQSDTIKDFNTRYKKLYGSDPASSSGAITYDSTMMLLGCIQKRGVSTEQVRDCLAETSDFVGASGKLSFNGGQSVKDRKMVVKELGR